MRFPQASWELKRPADVIRRPGMRPTRLRHRLATTTGPERSDSLRVLDVASRPGTLSNLHGPSEFRQRGPQGCRTTDRTGRDIHTSSRVLVRGDHGPCLPSPDAASRATATCEPYRPGRRVRLMPFSGDNCRCAHEKPELRPNRPAIKHIVIITSYVRHQAGPILTASARGTSPKTTVARPIGKTVERGTSSRCRSGGRRDARRADKSGRGSRRTSFATCASEPADHGIQPSGSSR
jgi:hypothetical protein